MVVNDCIVNKAISPQVAEGPKDWRGGALYNRWQHCDRRRREPFEGSKGLSFQKILENCD